MSTLILLKAAWRTLKLCINSCSSLAWNLTFFRRMQPGNNMSMNWQYAAPAKHKRTTTVYSRCSARGYSRYSIWRRPLPYLSTAVRSWCRWGAKSRWPTPACHVGWGCQWTPMWRTHSLPSPTYTKQQRQSLSWTYTRWKGQGCDERTDIHMPQLNHRCVKLIESSARDWSLYVNAHR